MSSVPSAMASAADTRPAAAFHSILFEAATDRGDPPAEPDFFHDLALDKIVDAVIASREVYDLKAFFWCPLHRCKAVEYRQQVMRELENSAVRAALDAFATSLGHMHALLTATHKLYDPQQKRLWFLDAVGIYCAAVTACLRDLSAVTLESRGLQAWRRYLAAYTQSAHFQSLAEQTLRLRSELAKVRYCLLINGPEVRVRKYEQQDDFSAEIAASFAKFRQNTAARDYRFKFRSYPEVNSVEARVLEGVVQLHPDLFQRLDKYCNANGGYPDEIVMTFEREIQFYLAYLDYLAPLRHAGLPFCYPQVSDKEKAVSSEGGFDLALAAKLIAEKQPVVRNDFYLQGEERVLVVSGPNQGGKTTFARSFGQLHYLASLGCPVPGCSARLFLSDRLLTHFGRQELPGNLRSALEEDLLRMRDLLQRATPRSIVLLNEIFTSTTLQDAIFLSTRVLEKLLALDVLCVWVTFIEELSAFSQRTVSMVSKVQPDNPAVRTFKITRSPANGLAYAFALAEKHGVTYQRIKARLKT